MDSSGKGLPIPNTGGTGEIFETEKSEEVLEAKTSYDQVESDQEFSPFDTVPMPLTEKKLPTEEEKERKIEERKEKSEEDKSEMAASIEADIEALEQEEQHQKTVVPGFLDAHYHVALKDGVESTYNHQLPGSMNCFAATAAAMYNQHMRKLGKTDSFVINQYDVRAYVPAFKSKAEYESHREDAAKEFADAKRDVESYIGMDANLMGNVYALSDFFIQTTQDKNLCTNHSVFYLTGCSSEEEKKVKDYFAYTVSEVLKKGEAVGMLMTDKQHYVTIVGIQDDVIQFLDSTAPDPEEIQLMDMDDLIKLSGEAVELTWLSEKKDSKTMTSEYSDLSFDGTRYTSKSHLILEDIGHTLGVSAEKTAEEKERDGVDPLIVGRVRQHIYVPNVDDIPLYDAEQMRHDRADQEVGEYSAASVRRQLEELYELPGKRIGHREDVERWHAARARKLLLREQEKKASQKATDDSGPDDGAADEVHETEKKKPKEQDSEVEKESEEKKEEEKKVEEKKEEEKEEEGKKEEEKKEDKKKEEKKEEKKDENKNPAQKEEEEDEGEQKVQIIGTYNFAPPATLQSWCDVFLLEKDKGRSESFMAVKNALIDADEVLTEIKNGVFTFTQEHYEQLLRAYNAVNGYIAGHATAGFSAGQTRVGAAFYIKRAFDRLIDHMNVKNRWEALPDVEPTASKAEKDFALKNVYRLVDYYREYSQRVDLDLVASDEEKIRRKWDAIKSSERDLQIYFSMNKNLEKKDIYHDYLFSEYNSLRRQMLLINMKNGYKSETVKQKEDGLTDDQIQALSRIDTWVIRNFRNGGIASVFGVVEDRTDIVGRLLSMPRRKRMYVYYLVETRERVHFTMEGFIKSQTTYVPDVTKFKDMMIASKLKFYKRFTGGYIYWRKLTQAMDIAERNHPMIDAVEEILVPGAQKKKQVKNPSPQQQYDNLMRDMLVNVCDAMKHMSDLEGAKRDPVKNKDSIAAHEKALKDLAKEGKDLMSQMRQIHDALAKQRDEQYAPKEEAELMLSDVPKNIGLYGDAFDPGKWNDVVKRHAFDPHLYSAESVDGFYSYGIGAVAALGSIAGAIFSCLTLAQDHASMTYTDIGVTTASAAVGLVKTGKAIGSWATAGSTSTAAKVIGSTALVGAIAVVDTGIFIAKGASLYQQSKQRNEAKKLAGQCATQSEYKDGMIELQEILGKRQATSVIGSGVSTALSLTATALIASGVATAGVTAIAGGVALIAALIFKGVDVHYKNKMKYAIFDRHFHTMDVYNTALANWKQKNPGRSLTKKQEERMLETVRNRIAAQHGFYNTSHAAKGVAFKYANYLLYNVRNNTPEAKMCEAMIRGLGLDFKYDPQHPEDNVPTEADIVKKMCG